MPPIEEEKVIWSIFGLTVPKSWNDNTLRITPIDAGKKNVNCKINSQLGITKAINVVPAGNTRTHFKVSAPLLYHDYDGYYPIMSNIFGIVTRHHKF